MNLPAPYRARLALQVDIGFGDAATSAPQAISGPVLMTEATFTFRVEEELKESFTTAAKARDRTAAQLLRDFMRDFVKKQQEAADHDLGFRRQVQEGLDSANSGNLVAGEDVEAEFAKRREQTRQKLNAKS